MDYQDIIIYSCPAEGAFCILSLYFFKPFYYSQSCFSGALFNVQEKILILDHYFQNAFLSIQNVSTPNITQPVRASIISCIIYKVEMGLPEVK